MNISQKCHVSTAVQLGHDISVKVQWTRRYVLLIQIPIEFKIQLIGPKSHSKQSWHYFMEVLQIERVFSKS